MNAQGGIRTQNPNIRNVEDDKSLRPRRHSTPVSRFIKCLNPLNINFLLNNI
jgi:hypothetical protein